MAAALHGHGGLDAIDSRRLSRLGVQIGVDEPWSNRVDANAFFGDFLRQANGERIDGALASGVVDVLAGRSRPRRTRGDVYDRSSPTSMARRHSSYRFAATQESSNDVGGESSAKARGVHRVEPCLALDGSGVIDKGGEVPQFAVDCFEKAYYIRFRTDVGLHGHSVSVFLLNGAHDLCGFLALSQIVDADRKTSPGSENSGGRADPSAGARHNQNWRAFGH